MPSFRPKSLIGMRALIAFACFVAVVSLTVFINREISNRYARDLLHQCKGKDIHCMADVLADTTVEYGTKTSFGIVKNLYSQISPGALSCFSLTDQIGESTVQRQHNFRELKLTPESTFCNYGFYQAYARELLLESKDTNMAQQFCSYVSQSLGTVSSGAVVECYRGVGQALPFILADIQGQTNAMSSYAIHMCETLAPEGDSRNACVSGLFNRIGYAEIHGLYGLSVDTEDPLSLCHTLFEKKYLSHCEGNFKRAVVNASVSHDLTTALGDLKRRYPNLTDDDLQSIAFTVGYDSVVASVPSPDFKRLAESCLGQPEPLQGRCISGTAVGLAKNGTPGNQDKQVKAFCELAAQKRGPQSQECPSDQALQYMKGFFPLEKFAKVCREFEMNTGVCAK